MRNPFNPGDQKRYSVRVSSDKIARFKSGIVHPVYSTFALGQDAEWACRLFVLDMKEPHEEGIGTYLSVNHISPAKLGSNVTIIATLEGVEGNSVICTYQAFVGGRLIAEGEQIQKIISKEKLRRILTNA